MECESIVDANWTPDSPPRGMYRRLFFSRRLGLKPNTILPRITCQGNLQADAQKLARYKKVIQDPNPKSDVPLFFPHVLLGSAHLAIISHEQFPLRSLGLLHIRNHVIRYRPFGIANRWDMKCELSRQRHVEKGLEFDFDATITIDGEIVWRSISTYLKRGKPLGEIEESPLAELFPSLEDHHSQVGEFPVPKDIGKRYAKITGDYNPIHVSNLAAKLFGFKRAIAHGMWSVARAITELPPIDGPIRHDVVFKGPMFVSSKATVKTGADGQFDVFCGGNPRPVIVGAFNEAFEHETFD